MRHLRFDYEDKEFEKMLKLKTKLGITWKTVISRGLKGGKDGNN